MEANFERDLVVSFDNCLLDMETHEIFNQEALERSLNKLCILRLNPEDSDKKIKGMHFAREVDLPIKKAAVTRCLLKTEEGEVLTDSLELDIFSISEAEKSSDNDDEMIKWLKFMGADTPFKRESIADGDEILLELNKSINEFINSDVLKKRTESEKNGND